MREDSFNATLVAAKAVNEYHRNQMIKPVTMQTDLYKHLVFQRDVMIERLKNEGMDPSWTAHWKRELEAIEKCLEALK